MATSASICRSTGESNDSIMTLCTIEPVVSTTMIKANGTSVRSALEAHLDKLEIVDPISIPSSLTTVKVENQLISPWAEWIVWRLGQQQGWSDSVCLNSNFSGTVLGFSVYVKGTKTAHYAITPEIIHLLSPYAKNPRGSLYITAGEQKEASTKLIMQSLMDARRASALRLYGNRSMQYNGSPNQIEHLRSPAFSILKRSHRKRA